MRFWYRSAVIAGAFNCACFVVTASICGCTLGAGVSQPSDNLPAQFVSASSVAAAHRASWWTQFNSDALNKLMSDALDKNQDIAAAVARITQADAQLGIAGAPLLPTVTLNASDTWQRSTLAGAPFEFQKYALGLNASYELDFWGKNRATMAAARSTLRASALDKSVVKLSVEASVTSIWFQALGQHDRLIAAQQALNEAKRLLAALQGRVNGGMSTQLDVSQQKALVASIEASLPGFESQERQYVLGLGILSGTPPESLRLTPGSLFHITLPDVPAGLPSDLLRSRPDIVESAARLDAALSSISAARADFFPAITLTGFSQVNGVALSTLLNPANLLSNIAGAISQPLFDNGRISAEVDLERGAFAEAVAEYRKTVLRALTDVEVALTAIKYSTAQENLAGQAVEAAREAASAAEQQMTYGTSSIVNMLQAQQALFTDLDTLAQARQAHALAVVSLFQALGGDFNETKL